MTMIAIATPRDGDTVRELRRALNALGMLQISDAAVVCQPAGEVKLQVPDACAEKVFVVLRDAGIGAIRDVRDLPSPDTIADKKEARRNAEPHKTQLSAIYPTSAGYRVE